ncbi:MAG TPA: PepSY domain-containing protein [Burkholderiales bacterium]|nr:PepSY domain-containing protein [Burkholderiales bacterium]
MHRSKQACGAIILSIAAVSIGCGPAVGVEPDSLFPALDECLQAAPQKQEGVVTRWQLTSKEPPFGFEIDILAPNNYVWSMRCTEATVGAPVRKLGNKDYKKLTARVKVPEKSARFTAIGAYPSVAEVSRMQLDLALSFKGTPYYTYEVTTNDGRSASVEVNADTGQIDYTKSERK